MASINASIIHSRQQETGQQDHDHGLGQSNLSATDAIVRRGKEALDRQRRAFEDWIDIAEALQVGRAEVMRLVHTNQPLGENYEKAMAGWLNVNAFHSIDKCTRAHLLECLQHRQEIENWRALLTEPERLRFNHPTTVLRKWKAATAVPNANASPKTSAIATLKDVNIEIQERLHRAERELSRGGGDLWSSDDTVEDIATVMVAKLSPSKAARVAHAMLKKLNDKKPLPSKSATKQNGVEIENAP